MSKNPKWNKTNEEKRAAHRAVSEALRSGRLAKPATCESCGSAERLMGHHEDYDEPLVVKWLCGFCHAKVHGRATGDRPLRRFSRPPQVVRAASEKPKVRGPQGPRVGLRGCTSLGIGGHPCTEARAANSERCKLHTKIHAIMQKHIKERYS